jgi:HNH endonuclease
VPATESEWLAKALGKTVRQVEDMVSGRKQGDRPDDPCDPKAKRHVLRLELSGDALAAFREARRHLELEVGHSLDDDEAVRMLAHGALGGEREPGRAAYQIAITVCEECGRGTRDGAGRVLEIEPHEVEAACCDAQNIGSIAHVGGTLEKATQTIPPRTRRWVVRRDHGRCRVDGCRSAKHLEMHHLVPRIEGGTHDPSGLALLCDAHHRQIHAGVLSVTGNANERLEFRRADGTRVGERARMVVPSRRPIASRDSASPGSANEADAIDALRRLDVPAKYAREAVAAAAAAGAEDLESLLRHALQILGRTLYAHARTSSRAHEPVRVYQPRRAMAPGMVAPGRQVLPRPVGPGTVHRG